MILCYYLSIVIEGLTLLLSCPEDTLAADDTLDDPIPIPEDILCWPNDELEVGAIF